MEEDRAVGVDMDMLRPQYMVKDQGMTMELELYRISSRIWVLGLAQKYSNMHTL